MCIKFANSAYQWVDIKLFKLADLRIADPVALKLLLQHAHYPDSYAGTKATRSQHGPYRLDAITADSFTIVDTASAEATLRTWAEQDAPLADLPATRLNANFIRASAPPLAATGLTTLEKS